MKVAPAPAQVGVVNKTEITDYKVEPGDTLWGLAEKFYADPWTWPQIWEMNPQIADPHWIYPGQILKVKTEKGVPVYGEARKKKSEAPGTLFEIGNIPAFDTTFAYDTRVNQIDMIGEDSMEGAGELVNQIDGQLALGEHTQVYFTMKRNANVQLGDVFTIFRVQKELDHPISGARLGYLINLLGEVQTVDAATLANGKVVYTGNIIKSNSEIAVGDRVIPMSREALHIKLRPTDLELTGTVVHGPMDEDILLGTGKIAFIDLGIKQGVKVGNSFSVWHNSADVDNLPNYKVGNAIAIRVGDKTSTVLFTYSIRPASVGDTVITDVR
jgi:LysM repeat protein